MEDGRSVAKANADNALTPGSIDKNTYKLTSLMLQTLLSTFISSRRTKRQRKRELHTNLSFGVLLGLGNYRSEEITPRADYPIRFD